MAERRIFFTAHTMNMASGEERIMAAVTIMMMSPFPALQVYTCLFVSWTVKNRRTDRERYNMYSTNSIQYTHV